MTKQNFNAIDGNMVAQALIDSPDYFKEILRGAIQEILESEITNHLGAEKHQRIESRQGQRNGYKPRTLTTRVGKFSLLVPQARDGSFSSELFARYQRSEKALVLALTEMYLKGVSTRKVAQITEQLCGTSFSSSQISHLSKKLDGQIALWKQRSLGQFPYIFVDARYEKVRTSRGVVSQGVLIVMGVNLEGYREVLDVKLADSENSATYGELFSSLKQRGLQGVKLVVSDAHKGLKQAIERYFQGAVWQRCQVHFMREVAKRCAPAIKSIVAADIGSIFDEPTLKSALARAQVVADEYLAAYPKLSIAIEEDIEQCLSIFSFPKAHQKRLRTNNAIERLNKEIKRRTSVIGAFPSEDSAMRLICTLCMEQSDAWLTGHRYMDMNLLESEVTKIKRPKLLKVG